MEVTNLKIDQTLFFEKLRPKESKLYKVKNLKEGQKYEIRISYPSTVIKKNSSKKKKFHQKKDASFFHYKHFRRKNIK